MREVKIELLRISAMFLVLIVHTAYLSMGWPTVEVIRSAPLEQIWITFIQSLSIICVNVFVLISGWFGIKLKLKSLFSFLFQVFFFLVISYISMVTLGKVPFSVVGILRCITVIDSFWFVDAYLLLLLLSPVLNAFVEHTNKRMFKLVLIGFFLLQTFYGWLGLIQVFNAGYSTISFIGLYLLARYFRIYAPNITQFNQSFYLKLYLIVSVLLTIAGVLIAYIPILLDHLPVLSWILFSYNNPLVILEACAFFFFFEKIHSPLCCRRTINSVASSSFAVYLLHANPFMLSPAYKPIVQNLYKLTGSAFINGVSILAFVIGVFILSILMDKMRIYIWNMLWLKVEHPIRRIVDVLLSFPVIVNLK